MSQIEMNSFEKNKSKIPKKSKALSLSLYLSLTSFTTFNLFVFFAGETMDVVLKARKQRTSYKLATRKFHTAT